MTTKTTNKELLDRRKYARAWRRNKGIPERGAYRLESDNLAPALLTNVEISWLVGILKRK